MSTAGGMITNVNNYIKLRFSWARTSYSMAKNTSTIEWKMELLTTANGKISSTASKKWSVTVNGTKYSGTNTVGISASSTKTLASGTTTITHNTDGSKTFSYSFSQEFNITFSGTNIGTKSGNGSGTLDNIPKKATIRSATDFNDEENPQITYYNQAGNEVDALEACIVNSDGSVFYADYRSIGKTGTSYTFSLTDAERKALRKAITKGSTLAVKFCIRTTVGNEKLYSTVAKTLTLINHKPTVNPVIKDIGSGSTALTSDGNKIIKYFNYISINSGAAARKEATIKSVKVACGSKYITSSSGVLENVESGSFVITVTDNRGNITTQTVNKTLVGYVKLTCNLTTAAEIAEDNTATAKFTIKGNCFNGSFGGVNNTLTVQYRYKTSGGSYSSWTAITATQSGNKYEATGSIAGLDYRTTYVIQARAIDKISTGGVNSEEKSVKATPVFDWGAEDFKFNVPVNMAANINGYGADTAALNMNNSDIVGCNSIYFADESISGSEAIHFYRDGSTTDALWASQGNLYFTPNFPTEKTNYNISGLFRAMTTTYQLDTTTVDGTNYTVGSATAHLTGNMLRIYFTVTRSSNTGTGNIANETVATVKIAHNGKIKGMNNISFGTANTGGVAAFTTSNITNSSTELKFDIILCATATAGAEFNSFFVAPVAINPDNF